jgi:hypothetical protein
VVVVTEVFSNLALTAARARGLGSLRMIVLPHPMESRPTDEIRRIAADRLEEISDLLVRRP